MLKFILFQNTVSTQFHVNQVFRKRQGLFHAQIAEIGCYRAMAPLRLSRTCRRPCNPQNTRKAFAQLVQSFVYIIPEKLGVGGFGSPIERTP